MCIFQSVLCLTTSSIKGLEYLYLHYTENYVFFNLSYVQPLPVSKDWNASTSITQKNVLVSICCTYNHFQYKRTECLYLHCCCGISNVFLPSAVTSWKWCEHCFQHSEFLSQAWQCKRVVLGAELIYFSPFSVVKITLVTNPHWEYLNIPIFH